MNDRRAKRKTKKKAVIKEAISCIVFLSSSNRDSEEIAERRENKQLHYINEYADAHGLIPMKIIRRGCFAPAICNDLFKKCIYMMCTGKAEAILVANMELISTSEADSYYKVGLVRQHGFRLFSVDEGELKLDLASSRRVGVSNEE